MSEIAAARANEHGYVTPVFIVFVGLTMTLLAMFANILAVHYARGVMQSSAEEAARQGVAVGTGASCTARAQQAVAAGLGSMAQEVHDVHCTVTPTGAVVQMSATFTSWIPGVPEREVAVTASARGQVEQ